VCVCLRKISKLQYDLPPIKSIYEKILSGLTASELLILLHHNKFGITSTDARELNLSKNLTTCVLNFIPFLKPFLDKNFEKNKPHFLGLKIFFFSNSWSAKQNLKYKFSGFSTLVCNPTQSDIPLFGYSAKSSTGHMS
jgi:hypothetical protein